MESAASELGAAVTGCAKATTGFASGVLTLSLDANAAVISAPGGKITVNGYVCVGDIAGVDTQLTTLNVSKLAINGDSSANKVILDMLPGSFGTKILANTGGILVDFLTADGGADSFMIRGGTGAETYKFGKDGTTSEVYVEVTGDKAADIGVKPGTGGLTLTASMGGGADTLIANPVAADITSFQGSAVVVGTMTANITAYGGAGDDKFTGGDGDDTFYGGDNNDTFKMAVGDDGSDTYVGEAGNDTVDYSNRTAAVTVDIGPQKPSIIGTANLATIDYTMLSTKTLIFSLDGAADVTVTFQAADDTPAEVLSRINTAAAGVASMRGLNQLVLSATSALTTTSIQLKASTSTTLLGLTVGTASTISGTTNVADADDGLSGENDDVRYTTENIKGGKGNDILYGDSLKNTITGGDGDDKISGGANATCNASTDGDSLSGEVGDDTFYMPVFNCYASLSGGTGANAADFSGRTVAVSLSNNAQATDGEGSTELVNIAADIQKMIGGFGNDTITGGSGNDILVGGPGGDILSGGAGSDDIVDYSAYTVGTTVTLCFTAAVTDCPTANDGKTSGELDQVHAVEHVIGGTGVDNFSAAGATVDVTFEGGDGNDVFVGGDGNDTLWGDDDDDSLTGGPGDDNINGGADNDTIIAGTGDGDICVSDSSDLTPATGCEL
ncbi:MAG TPA: calcium-binding protein [Polyangiales bacterium]|nr:calcium-binding protein [Polyangiales bacterium]